MRNKYLPLIALTLTAQPALADEYLFGADFGELTGEIAVEGRFFPETPKFAAQDRHSVAFSLRPEGVLEWDEVDFLGGAGVALSLIPFLRIDTNDEERTHLDFREAKADIRLGDTDVTIGNDIVFWGKTEVDQLVDIINQTDGLEGSDGAEKLGQPMLALRRLVDIGDFSGEAAAFYMPYFRERQFLGEESRLRLPFAVDTDNPVYTNGDDEWTPSFAGRLAGFYGDVDAGIHVFQGMSRDPSFQMVSLTEAQPVYGEISQIGVDAQYTRGETLFKFEGIHRWDQINRIGTEQDYFAAIGGVEHTLFGINEQGWDLGLIAEYAYDERGDTALSPFDNDVVLGGRLAMNDIQDSSVLFTAAVDTDTHEGILRLEGERRIGDSFKASVEGLAFVNSEPDNPFEKDSSIRLRLSAFW